MNESKTSPAAATLVAILVAARRSGDRELERQARRQLQHDYGVKLSFTRDANETKGDSDENE